MMTVTQLLAMCIQTTAYAVASTLAPQLPQEATTETVIVCADPESPDPEECIFTAPADGAYSFVWAQQPSDGFDLIKLGLEPVDAVYIGDRFGVYFTDCCDGGPCEFVDTNLVRYTGGACSGAPSVPIPGDPPPPPPPDNPPCEPDPGLPPITCCALEPSGACQRPCCCDSGGEDYVEGYCRGAATNRTTTISPVKGNAIATASNYSGLVVRAQLLAGQSLLLITSDGGLMSKHGRNSSNNDSVDKSATSDGNRPRLPVSMQPSASAFRARQDVAIVCADPDGPGNPSECQFTAPAAGRYSFVWAAAASFDVVKLGAEPIPIAYVGDRFGVYFTSCCDSEGPCLWESSNPIRFADTCPPGSATAPIPGDPPPPPPPDNPPCEPDPGLPPITCCALEPSGACQRPCCCDSGGEDYVEGYCRGAATNSSSSSSASVVLQNSTSSRNAEPSDHGSLVYGGLVVGLELEEGFTVTLLTQSGGLM